MNDIYDVIKKPRVSEKATVLHEENGVLTLEVAVKATKIEIKQAVEKAFGKKVASVRTANYDGKVRRKRTKDAGTAPAWKKAFVRLAAGESLDLV
ncbi:MAG: 50S ribosomal protein L23 [Akkermansia sp.]|jgi:large subunit ribosomal protein L23|nr:50S ribosomal protein L23 [Akkermansia sp.]MBR5890001.1 50S ribosomal protein L23 [Akkermansia sp.]MEE1264804.1 50S ribosomal protein L23 [Akkermansia sp.]